MSANFMLWPAPRDLTGIQAVWCARGSTSHHREAVLPNGVTEIIINLGDPQWVVGDSGRPQRRFDDTFVAGLQVTPLLIEDRGTTELLGIRFTPGGLAQWLATPSCELTGRVLTAEELGLRWLNQLRARLLETRGDEARVKLIFELMRAHRLAEPVDRRVRATLTALAANEHVTLGRLARELGLTHQHLGTLFRQSVGVPPRLLFRVLRFHSAVTALRAAPPGTRLAAIAAGAGYADQAHFNRDFRELAGCTPSHYLARRTVDGWHLIAD